MKYILFVFFTFLGGYTVSAQQEQHVVEQTILEFFEAFHSKDTLALKALVVPEIIQQTVVSASEQMNSVSNGDFNQFVKNIASIPETTQIKEELLAIETRITKGMAHAWTPYVFYVNGAISHCGVNSFLLVKQNKLWKITHIIDTRTKEGCSN